MYKSILLALLLVLLMSSVVEAAARPASVQNLRYSNTGEKVRIVLDVTKECEFKELYLENPSRLIVDVENASLSSSVQKEYLVGSPLVSRIRIGQFNPTTVRVVIESMSEINIFWLDGGPSGCRLVIDVIQVPSVFENEKPKPQTTPTTPPKPNSPSRDDDQKARLDAERKAKEEAERKAKLEAERKAKEEAERKAKLEAERKAKEEAELKAKEEAELKAKEERARKAKEERERKEKEEKERKAKEEAEKKAKEEEKKAKEERERKAKEERERKIREAREERERRQQQQHQPTTPSAPTSEVDKDLEQLMTLKGKVIAIDPGHGGNDAGAIGPTGVMEKTVTLNVSLELEKLLKAHGATVIMTRRTDKTVSPAGAKASAIEELQARCDVANAAKADIFISIHADSFTNSTARGTTGYYYAETEGPMSIRLADCIRKALCDQIKTPSRGTKPCNFYVVRNTDMAATLVELAFISNPEEEALMSSVEGVLKCAQGILDGIEDFFG